MRRIRSIWRGLSLGVMIWSLHDLGHIVIERQGLHDWYEALWTRENLVDCLVFLSIGLGLGMVWEAWRRLEAELRKMSRVVEQSPSIVVITDLQGNIEYVNPKFTQLTGYTLDEVRGKNPRILKSGETPPEEYARLWKSVAAGGEWRGELHNVKKNGERYWESASMSAIKNSDGEITHYLAVKEDITARKEAEAAEREQHALADALRQTAAVVNSTLELDELLYRILVNLEVVLPHDSAYLMVVEDQTARVVRTCQHIPAERREKLVAARFPVDQTPFLQQMAETGQPLLIEDVSPETGFPFEAARSYLGTPIKYEGKITGFLSLESTIPHFYSSKQLSPIQAFADEVSIAVRNSRLYESMRQHANEMERVVVARTQELSRQRAQLQVILDSMVEGVMYVSNENEITYLNRALLRIVGRDQEAQIDLREFRDWLIQYLDYPAFLSEMSIAFREKEIWQTERQLAHRTRGSFEAIMVYAPVFDETGKRVGRVAIVRDVSEEKALQAQKERFLMYAAHELRTPLANLKTRLYLLRRQPEKLIAHLDVMDNVMADMIRLVEDLLDVVRFTQKSVVLDRHAFELDAMMQGVITQYQDMAEQKNIQLLYTASETPLAYYGDGQRIKQVMDILLESAIAYTTEGEAVSVHLENNETHAILRLHFGGAAVPPDQMFEPFFRLPGGGSGLGLTLAQEIIRLHHGRIEAQPGNIFSVQLPMDCHDVYRH
ncbi:MAG TPA: PAS domain S-box protein [Aggregatilineaceae bacterium]|nr:PAS domain S-box protein [Aggregatilineaceae bacterium]